MWLLLLSCDWPNADMWHYRGNSELTLLCHNQTFPENPELLMFWYNVVPIINKHLEYLVVKDSRQLVDDQKQAVLLRIRPICCWTSYCSGWQEKNSFGQFTRWRRLLHSLALAATHRRQKHTVLRPADRISSLSLGRNNWMKSNVQISFHFLFWFILTCRMPNCVGFKAAYVLVGCFQVLVDLTGVHSWHAGAHTCRRRGRWPWWWQAARGGCYSSKMPSRNRVQMLFCAAHDFELKKKGPTTTNHPPSLRRRHYFGFILQLFVGK